MAYLILFFIKVPFAHIGYNSGVKAIDAITKNAEKIARSASILGVTVIEALISTYVHIELLPTFVVDENITITLQKDLIDTIFPSILPSAYTLLMYYLMKKRKVKSVTLIFLTFISAIVLSFFGIL